MAKRKSRSRKGSYKMTAKRRAALKKAQAVSARKRKAAPNKRSPITSSGRSGYSMSPRTKRNLAIGATGVAVTALTAGGVVARHKLSGSSFSRTNHPIASGTMGNITGSHAASLSTSVFRQKTGGKVTKEHAYIRKNLQTKEKTTVTRHVTSDATKVMGRDFTFNSRKRGPLGDSFSITYKHRKARITAKDILGTKLHNKILASQHFSNPFAPRYEKESTRGYGASGKRLPKVEPRKFFGGKEIFPGYKFSKGKSVSWPSRDIRLGPNYTKKKFDPKKVKDWERAGGSRSTRRT